MTFAALTTALRPIGLWPSIGLHDPQQVVRVVLVNGTTERDVTGNQVILSLVPLRIGVGLPKGAPHVSGVLSFRDGHSGCELGTLALTPAGSIDSGGVRLACYEVRGGRHACLPMFSQGWQRLLRLRPWRGNAPNFRMRASSVQHLQVLYICPRPVLLVSVDDGIGGNLFPMDLVGSVHGGGFTLALRNTSPSVPTLKNAGRAALAHVAFEERDLAYELGKHHSTARIDWQKLPFATTDTPRFGLRVPAHALRIREVEITTVEVVGSHTVFVCSVLTDETRASALQLFHTSGIHRAWRRRRGALPWSETSAP